MPRRRRQSLPGSDTGLCFGGVVVGVVVTGSKTLMLPPTSPKGGWIGGRWPPPPGGVVVGGVVVVDPPEPELSDDCETPDFGSPLTTRPASVPLSALDELPFGVAGVWSEERLPLAARLCPTVKMRASTRAAATRKIPAVLRF